MHHPRRSAILVAALAAGPAACAWAQECDCVPDGNTYDAGEDCGGHICPAPYLGCSSGWTTFSIDGETLCLPTCLASGTTTCKAFATAIRDRYYPLGTCSVTNMKCWDNEAYNSPSKMRSVYFAWIAACEAASPTCDRDSDGDIDCADAADFIADMESKYGVGDCDAAELRRRLLCGWVAACRSQTGKDGGACVDAMQCASPLIGDSAEYELFLACLTACETPGSGDDNPKPVPGPFPAPWLPQPRTCGGGDLMAGFSNGTPPMTFAPVDAAYGDKIESATDLVVPLAGIPFAITREYTSDPGYSSPAPVGEHWTTNAFRYAKFEVATVGGVTCCSAKGGGMAGGVVTMPCTCDGAGFGSQIDVPGPTAQRFDKATASVGGTTYAVWRLAEPGQWRMDFYREKESADTGAAETPEALVGKLARVSDPYGNHQDFSYGQFALAGSSGTDARLSGVTCYAQDGEVQARVWFFYALGPSSPASALSGKLLGVEVTRPHQTLGVDVPVQRVWYTYLEDDDSGWLGTAGDLVQVETQERVDPAPGDTSGDPVWRSRITQYRYHTGTGHETTDADGDGYVEKGGAHQLKMAIMPEQVEHYAQLRAEAAGGTHAVGEYAGDLMGLADGATDGAGLKPAEIASKVVEEYETSGDRRVLAEYVLTGCGCSGGASQGLRCQFEYWTYTGGRTTKVTESRKSGSSWTAHRVRYADMALVGEDSPGWYLVNDVVADPSRSGLYWATHYERSQDDDQTLDRVYTPAAMSSYTPATSGTAPDYEGEGDGLVYAYAHQEAAYVSEVRIHPGKPATDTLANYFLVSKTTFRTGAGETHLPSAVERVRTEGQTSVPSTAAEVERVEYDYGFHNADKAIAWSKTTVEAESTSENGPGGTYSSYEVYDARGLNTWSVAADGSTTKRTFDNDEDGTGGTSVSRTGSVARTTRNASRGSGSGFPTAAPYDATAFAPAADRSADGGSLATAVRRDILGRVQETASPGGVTHVTTREMRTSASRPNLLHYAEVSLPFNLSGTTFDGPATVTWIGAGGKPFESRGYRLTANHTAAGTTGPYRQVYSSYALDTSSTGLLSRSEVEQFASGLVHRERRWRDPNASGSYYETQYEYDTLGRVDRVTRGDNEGTPSQGTVTRMGTDSEAGYDFLDRLKATAVSAIGATGSQVWTVVERRHYDSAPSGGSEVDGVGNGKLTFVARPVDSTSAHDRTARTCFDWRDRPVAVVQPGQPTQVTFHDNLDRTTESLLTVESLSAAPAGTSSLDDDDFRAYSRTTYSQRGAAVRTETAIDPAAVNGSPTFLASNTWLDEAGRPVGRWGPNAPATKTTYDGLGRVAATYVTDRGGDQNPQPPTGSYSGYADVHASHASVLTGDTVLEQTSQRYITASGLRQGLPDLATVRRRAHDQTTTGSLDVSGSTAVASFAATCYDAAERVSRTADYGTAMSDFRTGGTAPTVDQSSPPGASDTVLVSIVEYDERGLAWKTTDPDGKVSKTLFDGLGRPYATIENFVDATVSWSSSLGRWIADGVGTTDGTDRVTSMVYDGQGRATRYVAHQEKASADGDRDQVTQYVYGVTPDAVSGSQVQSGLWTNDLLLKAIYPDEGAGGASEADRTVWYGYDRQGELVSMEDQNDTLHTYSRDAAGRVTADLATLASGSPIDGSILEIDTAYDDAGRPSLVTSTDGASTPTVRNQVQFEYTPLWQVSKVWQHDKGAVAQSSGAPTGDTRLVAYAYATNAVNGSTAPTNHSRLSSMDYPRNHNGSSPTPVTATLAYGYGSGAPAAISRVESLSLDSLAIVNYAHVGLGVVALVDYARPDVQLDRTFSHEGKRRTVGYTTQNAGLYPGLDRFGRVATQAWVDGNLTQHHSSSTVSNVPPILELGYGYDRAGSRTAARDLRVGNQWRMSQQYTYDGLHRLTQASRGVWDGSSFSTSTGGSQEWTLDPLGNWARWKNDADFSNSYSAAETEDRTHNGVNELTQRDQGTGGTDETLTYDAAGNLRTRVANSVTTTYTHDAWNRLVKVAVGSGTVLEQEHNGLGWRTVQRADTDASGSLDEERTFAYSADWRLLEERVDSSYVSSPGLNKRVQHVWGKRYIDDAVSLRADLNNDGDYADSNEGTWYHVTDAMFSSVALVAASNGALVERVTYDAYGHARHHFPGDVDADGDVDSTDRTIVNGVLNKTIDQTGYRAECDIDRDGTVTTTDRTTASTSKSALAAGLVSVSSAGGPDNPVGWDGYVLAPAARAYAVRRRTYEPVLGRWMERDPITYSESSSLYSYVDCRPSQLSDPRGLQSFTPISHDRWFEEWRSRHFALPDSVMPEYLRVYDRGCIGVTCIHLGATINPDMSSCFDSFQDAESYATTLQQTGGCAGLEDCDGGPSSPRIFAVDFPLCGRSLPAIGPGGRRDMQNWDLNRFKPNCAACINFDFSIYDPTRKIWTHANHYHDPSDPMEVHESDWLWNPLIHYSDFDRRVFCVACEDFGRPGRLPAGTWTPPTMRRTGPSVPPPPGAPSPIWEGTKEFLRSLWPWS